MPRHVTTYLAAAVSLATMLGLAACNTDESTPEDGGRGDTSGVDGQSDTDSDAPDSTVGDVPSDVDSDVDPSDVDPSDIERPDGSDAADATPDAALDSSDAPDVATDAEPTDAPDAPLDVPRDADAPGDPDVGDIAPTDLGRDADPEVGAAELCAGSGGRWDETSCGDYVCGAPPLCDAIIPGCDCGPGRTYTDGRGCAVDPGCGSEEQAYCEATGGRWDELSCGHYRCGAPPGCLALIPGCDCGEAANFVDGAGCVVDASCGGASRLCERTGGRWDTGGCGYSCGTPSPILCLLPIPDCQCAAGENFDPVLGCVGDPTCPNSAERLCEETLGRWNPTGCGDAMCGVELDCDAIIPGCNCGRGRVFGRDSGCFASRACYGCPDPMADRVTYVGGSNFDPSICERIDYFCPDGLRAFSDPECGCGCMP
ncbi:MAG: hypothetical protein H6698_03050 [Myxococcales bacterium]|nr:hypothetical protein [Myxococcales bacterium]MCB9533293.1 hypothetical protein [Myxococcales bacterium]